MTVFDDQEPDPFLQKKEWCAFQKKRRHAEEASPEYKGRQDRIRILSRVVSFMIYPDGQYRWKGMRLDRKGILFQSHTASEPLKPGGYPCNSDFYLFHALQSYCVNFRNESLSATEEKINLLDVSVEDQTLISEACDVAKWPYKLGAALYLHHQMVMQPKYGEPSQSKSYWLVAKAPLKSKVIGGKISLRPDGGEPSKIGDQLKKYYSVAHFWAALVVWAKSPLVFPNDRFVLLDFICNANVDEFLANAALFRKFRTDLKVTKTNESSLILIKELDERDDKARDNKVLEAVKPGPEDFLPDFCEWDDPLSESGGKGRDDNVLEGIKPSPESLIPNLLLPFQWEALEQYRTRKRQS